MQTNSLDADRLELGRALQAFLKHHPGQLAQELREREGLSVAQVADRIGVDHEVVERFECKGFRATLDDVDLQTADGWQQERSAGTFERYVQVLSPTAEEEAVLRHDRDLDVKATMDTLCDFLGLGEPPPPADPWDQPTVPCGRAPRSTRQLTMVGETPEPAPAVEAGPTLRFKLQLVVEDGSAEEAGPIDLGDLTKRYERIDHMGLTLDDSKTLLRRLQQHVVTRQLEAAVRLRGSCARCGRTLGRKGEHHVVLRTLFGRVEASSPRLRRCRCSGEHGSFSPLHETLPERTTPELLYLEAKWASAMSYENTARMLADCLPVDDKMNAATVHNHVARVAERLEAELAAPEPPTDRAPSSAHCPGRDDAPLTVGIDGGYIRSWRDRTRQFEVLVGKSVPADGPAKCFGMVRLQDDRAGPRITAALRSAGVRPNASIRFLSDGERSMRDFQQLVDPGAVHILDWFHVSMRWTQMRQLVRAWSRSRSATVPMDVGAPVARCNARPTA